MNALDYKAAIAAELERLNADTSANPYSGITVEAVKPALSKSYRIEIFDDYDRSVITNPEAFLASLQKMQPLNPEADVEAFESVWDAANA